MIVHRVAKLYKNFVQIKTIRISENNFLPIIKTMSVRTTGSCKNAMQDCRAFTDYNPNCALNEHIRQKAGVNNSTEYRLYLQRNACKIMADERKRSDFENPTGCKCNYLHPPHDYEHDRMFSRVMTPAESYARTKDFNKPLCAYGSGKWTNFC